MSVFTAVRLLPLDESTDGWDVVDSKTIRNKEDVEKFDFVFWRENNEAVYDRSCKAIVRQVVDGFNGTVAAYGQSGSGKTHSLLGNDGEDGLLQLAVFDLLGLIAERSTVQYMVKMTAYEVYNEKLNDLLSPVSATCRIVDDKVMGAAEEIVESYDHFVRICQRAQTRRAVGETKLNSKSSRSHAVFQLIVESCSGETTTVSKLMFLDLAGSENSRTMSNSAQTTESRNINKSLLALSCVISAFAENPSKRVCSFRDSVLTRILKPVLGGNFNFLLFCCAQRTATLETSSTLTFAQKAKKMPNRAKKNAGTTDASLPNLVAQIDALKKQLHEKESAEQERKKDHLEQLLRKVFNAQPETDGAKASLPKRRHSVAFGGLAGVNFLSERRRQSATPNLLPPLNEDELDSGRSSRMSIEERPMSSNSCHESLGTKTEKDEEMAFLRAELAAETARRVQLEKTLEEEAAASLLEKAEATAMFEEKVASAESLAQKYADLEKKAALMEKKCANLEKKAALAEQKYADLKKRGLEMLKGKDADRAVVHEEAEKWKQLAHAEREKKLQARNELKMASDMVKEETRLAIVKKTECEALQEKLADMSVPARGCISTPNCFVTEHRYMANKIDVLLRQRDIITASLNEKIENN